MTKENAKAMDNCCFPDYLLKSGASVQPADELLQPLKALNYFRQWFH